VGPNKVDAAAFVAFPNRLDPAGPGGAPVALGNKEPGFVPVAGPDGVALFWNNPYGVAGAPGFPNAPGAPLWGAKSEGVAGLPPGYGNKELY